MGIKGEISKKKRRQLQRRKQKILLTGLMFVLILAVTGTVCFLIYRYVNKVPETVILQNIFIENVDVSGMTVGEAAAALQGQITIYGEKVVTFQGEEGIAAEVAFGDLGLDYKSADTYIKKAVEHGKAGSVWERYKNMKALEKEKKVIAVEYVVNPEAVTLALNERFQPLQSVAANATITRENGQFVIAAEKIGKRVDAEQTFQALSTYLNEGWNLEDALIPTVSTVVEPEVTRKDLETIQDVLGSFYTHAGYGDRVNNLQVGAERINGRVVMPGEEVSAAQMTGPYTEENGYYEATAYENGQVVPSIGGGICQVSTTLYNAALYAELEITQRAPHSMSVGYVKPSRDAAIAGDYKDLKFKNNYNTPIYLEGFIDEENQLYMIIYGKETREPGREVIYTSETISREESTDPVRYVGNSNRAIGYMEQTTGSYDEIEARLVKTVILNGETVSEEVENTSYYRAASAVITVGTASSDASLSASINDAIASQNRDAIVAAIARAT